MNSVLPRLTLLALAALTPSLAAAQEPSFQRLDQLEAQAPSRQRAINLARDTAIKLNGGLSVYRPAACMFATGSTGGSCLLSDGADGFRFRFNGGAPGWQQLGLPPTTTSEILIAPDGRSVVQVTYNGLVN